MLRVHGQQQRRSRISPATPPPCYRYLKIEKFDATQISDESVKHKETKFNEMTSEFKQVEDKGSKFISDAKQVRGGHDQFRVHVMWQGSTQRFRCLVHAH